MVCGGGERVDVRHRSFRLVNDVSIAVFEGQATVPVPFLPASKPLSQLQQRQLTLTSHHCIHERLAQSLLCGQAGVPTTKHNWQGWPELLNRFRNSYRGPNMRPGEDRNTQQESIFRLAQNGLFVIRKHQVIDEFDFKSSLQQRRGKTEQG